ncbi:hypothetical protein [Gallaecimonas mangrovi]|uniref:hypothetical protein n=1 Tax=Gallaecimonas mangrovi TaxID=2291597 RepID=UPI000E205478|nr:hypothetical protein [Gallaecimonas mangrovi]
MKWLRWILYLLVLVGLNWEVDSGWHWPTAILLTFVFVVVLFEWALTVRSGRQLGELRELKVAGDTLILKFDSLSLLVERKHLQPVHGGFLLNTRAFKLHLKSRELSEKDNKTLQSALP